ncbi:hypothetical protein H4Q26_004975 [Puccinia striiformis f. sp. tritici PST-130]|nr:hypothetical protein H4Q26_004975 [Puccinia striiformis f. sp. tritici PST-130]
MQTQQLPYEHGVYYDNPAQTPSVAEESLTRKKGNQSHIDPRLMQPQNSPYDHHGAYNYNSARSLPLAGRSQTIYLDTQLHAGQKFSDEQFLLALDASITYNRDLRQLPRAASFEEYMIQPHQPISKRAKQVMPEDDDGWVRFDQVDYFFPDFALDKSKHTDNLAGLLRPTNTGIRLLYL